MKKIDAVAPAAPLLAPAESRRVRRRLQDVRLEKGTATSLILRSLRGAERSSPGARPSIKEIDS
jgi:hypothetical protein